MSQRGKFGPNYREGAILRARREELKLSQGKIAERYSSSQTYISSIERGWEGISSASLDWIKRYAAALDWTAEELMDAVGIEHAKAGSKLSGKGLRTATDIKMASDQQNRMKISVNNTGSMENNQEAIYITIDDDSVLGDLFGLRMKHNYLKALPEGMIALYDSGRIKVNEGEMAIIEIASEIHIAYAIQDGQFETDTPINPNLPQRFRPDRVLGVVIRRIDDHFPRRLS